MNLYTNYGSFMRKHLFVLVFGIAVTLFSCGKSAETYNNELRSTADSISKYYGLSVSLCAVYGDAWAEAIDQSRDFNDALQAKYLEYSKVTAVLKGARSSIDSTMKVLTNEVPDDSKENYSKVLNFYNNYTEAHELAISPSGSLINFRARVGDLNTRQKKDESTLQLANLISPKKQE